MKDSTNQLTRDTNVILKELAELPQMVPSFSSVDQMTQNKTNPLIDSLNRKTNFNVESNTKQFSVEKFMTPSSLLSKKSHFYEGKTVFGGANTTANTRAVRLAGTTPYSLSQRPHLAPVLRVNVEPHKRLIQSNDTLSTFSQQIFERLEKASTPLQDARRIPSSSQSRNYFQTSDLLHRTTKRPKLGANPVLSHNSNETSFQPKRWELKLSDIEDNKVSSNETTKQLMNSCDNNNKYLIETNDNFGGKITRKDNKREERRPKIQTTSNGEPNDSLELLTTAQPLKMPSSLPTFSFGSKSSKKSPMTTVITKVNEIQDLNFKFSEPVLKIRDQKSDSGPTDESNGGKSGKPYVFSSPLSAITHKTSKDSEKVEKKSNNLKELQKTNENMTGISEETNYQNKKKIDNNIETNKSIGWGNKFKPPTGSWSCSVCMVTNGADKTKCVACEEPKPGAKVDKWICVCLFQNNSSDTKCKACNKERVSQTKQSTPSLSSKTGSTVEGKPITTSPPLSQSIGWGNKFKAPTGSWSCSVCMVTNGADKTKCVACEEPKPGGSITTTDSSKSGSELWQCFYCKHNNDISKNVCTSCAKIKTPIATKEDLDKLYGGQTFKFGITEEKKKEVIKQKEEKTDAFSKPSNNLLFSKENDIKSQTITSNAFVFGSTAEESKNKFSSDSSSSKPNDTSASIQPAFKFGAPEALTKTSSEDKPKEVSNANIADIFGSNKTSNSITPFTFGAPPTTTSSGQESVVSTTSNAEPSSLFVFGVQNKDQNFLNKNVVSFGTDAKKSESTSEKTTNKLSTDAPTVSFQIPKPTEEKQQIFKGFNSSSSGSLFGSVKASALSTTTTPLTTPSITSFTDNKFTLKSNDTQNQNIGSLFGGPTTTASSLTSSPFSLTNSSGFNSGLSSGPNPTTTVSQSTSSEGNAVKSLFSSLTPSSTIKSFDSMTSSKTNPLLNSTSGTPTAPLNSNSSSSPQKSLIFGNSNTNLQSFSSQSSTATTKPNFSFNLGTNTSANTSTTTTETTFGANSSSLFGSNSNKGFSFGNSSLNSSQTPGFSFTIPSSNSIPNTSSNINFGLNSNAINTTSADTKTSANQLFSFGGQNSNQFNSTSAQKTVNSESSAAKTGSQFSFGLSSNPISGQTNSTNLFANAISPAPNSLSFNQLAPTSGSAPNASPFTFGGFGSNASTPSMPQMQIRPPVAPQPQPSLSAPQFNFSAQPSFDFASMTNTGAPSTGPVFQFS